MNRQSLATALLLVAAPLGSQGQSQVSATATNEGPPLYGSAAELPLQYEHQAIARKTFLISFGQETAFDNNVLSNNAKRRSDQTFNFVAGIAVRQQRRRFSFAFDCQPGLLLYAKNRGFNAVNHNFESDDQYQVSSHVALRLRDSLHYSTTGIFEPATGQPFLPALVSPSSLNQNVLTPVAHQFETENRVDAIYQKSVRTSYTIFAGERMRHFGQIAVTGPNLLNTKGSNVGAEYGYRLARHSSLGALYIWDRFGFGNVSHGVVQSAFFSYSQQLSPTLTVSAFGDPNTPDSTTA